jgi:hypothetical protein
MDSLGCLGLPLILKITGYYSMIPLKSMVILGVPGMLKEEMLFKTILTPSMTHDA